MTRTNSVAGKRKNYSAEFKAKVAFEAIRGEATVAELVAKHGVHQTAINAWKRQALAGMAGKFSGKAGAHAAEKERQIEKLHTKIGQRVVERDFLAKASGR
jgi:transposase